MGAINFSEDGSKYSVYIKCWQFIDVLRNYKLLKKVCIPYSQADRQTNGRMNG